MPMFTKRPVTIEARLISAETTGDGVLDPNRQSIAEASGWMIGHGFHGFTVTGEHPLGIAINTLEGVMTASAGDYIIRGVQGEFYPCKPDIFEATYTPAVDEPGMRRFQLARDVDVSGVSGTGIVADGVEFPDGVCAVRWRGERQSTVVWPSADDVEAIHGHNGATRIVWLDEVAR